MTASMKLLKRLSVILIVVMIVTALFNVAYAGALPVKSTASTPEDLYPGLSNLKAQTTDEVNFDELRQSMMDEDLVQENTARFDGERWVIVELTGRSLFDAYSAVSTGVSFSEYAAGQDGKKVQSSIRKEQDSFLQRLNKNGISYRVKYNYTALSNGLALKVDAAGYNAIRKMSGVKDVYYSEKYAVPTLEQVDNNANVYTTGIYNTSELDGEHDYDGDGEPDERYQGEGMVVAILDTGLDVTHEAFQQMPTSPAWTKETLETKLEQLRKDNAALTAVGDVDDLYINAKVPFAYDYADDDNNVFPSTEHHGTHVAGIVAGKSDHKVSKDSDETFVGVAPEAQLAIFKVFTDNILDDDFGGGDSIDILAAVEDSTLLGVDVINMSLGSSAGFSDEKSDVYTQGIYDRVRAAGISLVVAASNDYSSGYGGGNGTNLASNPDSATVGSPSTYAAALSVASINGNKSKYIRANGDDNQIAFITNASDGNGNEIDFFDELFKRAEKSNTETVSVKYVLVGGVGRSNNYTSTVKRELQSRTYKDANGNNQTADFVAALIKRGDTTFAEKVQLAMSNGAQAVIIYNNVSGTIRMSLGEVKNPVPSCSIGMDASQYIFSHHSGITGVFELNYDMQAGPFMSDFSSWGPNPNLELKPEITAHGGEITSAVPGNGYDVLSGTSMATPNMAGGVAILRQYIKSQLFPDEGALTQEQNQTVAARVNQLLMSTATVARNEEGHPYSPRKQGAGLAGIVDAVRSEGYIATYTKDGETLLKDKSKLELGDDPSKTGVYTLKFDIKNTSGVAQSYKPNLYVMTETMASDKKTVAEKAFMFDASYQTTVWTVDGATLGANDTITVPAGSMTAPGTKTVTVTITLNQKAKQYLDANFVNGMYVEGFVSLANTEPSKVTLGVPYLAFYGDWTAAPMFDYDEYEIAASEADTSVLPEDKLKASAAATQILGWYYNEDYILPMGNYLYEQDEDAVQVYPAREKVAMSMYDDDRGGHTINSMYVVYAGLLRGAAYMDIVITDSITGEVIYSQTQENVSKSYAAGGSNRGAFVRMELNASEWGLKNNETYNVSLVGQLDYVHEEDYVLFEDKYATDTERYEYYGDSFLDKATGKVLYFKYPTASDRPEEDKFRYPAKQKNSFDFEFTADYEAPKIIDYRVRFDPYQDANKQTKYHIYMDLDLYDNQYIMSALPAYLKYDVGEGRNVLTPLTEYAIPVMGERGQQTTVSFEITDFYDEFVKTGKLYVSVDDYALNQEVYVITLDDENLSIPENDQIIIKVDKGQDATGKLVKITDRQASLGASRYEYGVYSLILRPNQMYKIDATTVAGVSAEALFEKLIWRNTNSQVKANGAEIFAAAATDNVISLQLTDARNKYVNNDQTVDDYGDAVTPVQERIIAEVQVSVQGKALSKPSPDKITVMPIFTADDFIQSVDVTGSIAEVELYPNQEIELTVVPSPWYCDVESYKVSSSNAEIVQAVDGKLAIRTNKEGKATITVEAEGYNMVRKSFAVTVRSEFDVRNYTLYEYYGGENVVIPDNLNIMYLDEECFRNNTDIKTVRLPKTLMTIPSGAFMGCTNLESIYIPGQVGTIFDYAFSGCTSLETVVLGGYVDSKGNTVYYGKDDTLAPGSLAVGNGAFMGCTSLKEIIKGNIIDTEDSEQEIDPNESYIPAEKENSARITSVYANGFRGCTALESIDLSNLRVADAYAFAGCTKLTGESVTTNENTAFGVGMFRGCTGITSFDFKGTVLPDEAFYGCTNLNSIEFSNKNIRSIGGEAFSGTKLSTVTLPDGEVNIDFGAFANCASLTKVVLQKNTQLNFASEGVFDGSVQFETFELPADGSNFYSVKNGALYNKAGNELICVPIKNSESAETLLSDVTAIGPAAFAGNQRLGAVVIPQSVESIGAYAFENSSLTSIALNANIKEIAEGVFGGCSKLTTVTNMGEVATIGDYAFAETDILSNLSLDQVSKIGAFAFAYSGLSTLTNTNNVEEVCRYAFLEAHLVNISMPKLEKIGEGAFARMATLRTVNVGPVKEMGDYAFASMPLSFTNDESYPLMQISSVTFADGATVVGNYAFAYISVDTETDIIDRRTQYKVLKYNTNTSLNTVTLPDTVTTIGEAAFLYSRALTTINLSHVTHIGANAFAGANKLANVGTLANVQYVGDGAFYGAAITTADLSKAEYIGSYAFAAQYVGDQPNGGKLESVTFGDSLKYLGSFAFYDTRLTSVELPAGFKATYEYNWYEPDDKGRVEGQWDRVRNVRAYGDGVFAACELLTEIKVADGNTDFVSKDGVLYSKLADGKYQLEQYPAHKTADTYTVIDDTVSIGNSAFEGIKGGNKINTIELPYTVKRIGNQAFYNCETDNYVFNSVEAPVLLSEYSENQFYYFIYLIINLSVDPRANEQLFWNTNFYANFGDYGAYNDEVTHLLLDGSSTGTWARFTMTIPLNGVGYDTPIWNCFFDNVVRTEDNRPTSATWEVIRTLEKLPALTAIEGATKEQLIGGGEYAKLIQAARVAYNSITDPVQLELAEVKALYDTLVAAEQKLRDVKKDKYGIKVSVSELRIGGNYKIRYDAGDAFDPTGLKVTVIYDDGTELDLAPGDYRFDKTTFSEGDRSILVIYDDEDGITHSAEILVNINSAPIDPIDPNDPSDSENGEDGDKILGMDKTTFIIVICVVGGVVLLAAAAVAVVLILKKRKANGAPSGSESGSMDAGSKMSVGSDSGASVSHSDSNASESHSDSNASESHSDSGANESHSDSSDNVHTEN